MTFAIQHRDGLYFCGKPDQNAALWSGDPEMAITFGNPLEARFIADHECNADPSDVSVVPLAEAQRRPA
jgi:hypothetical protein